MSTLDVRYVVVQSSSFPTWRPRRFFTDDLLAVFGDLEPPVGVVHGYALKCLVNRRRGWNGLRSLPKYQRRLSISVEILAAR